MQQILSANNYFPQNYEAQLGFTGIAVAFLGQNNPFGILAAAVMWAVLARGQDAIQIETNVPREMIIILQAILILSVVVAYPDRPAAHRAAPAPAGGAARTRTSRTRTWRPPDAHQPRGSRSPRRSSTSRSSTSRGWAGCSANARGS